ncbi:MAG: hydroxyacylglutathione hydrolase [Planctomycetota bacterium]|jgi:hydroxyacylglutathione hydrolase
MKHVITIPALGDNYIYLYKCADNTAFAIDPGDSKPVLSALESRSLTLSAVLATHNHFDHTAGARDLKEKTGCQIIGPERNGIPGIDRIVENGEIIELNGTKVRVIATPGHTAKSVCYYIQPAEARPGLLFTGDTLFIAGCGRIFEANAQTMWNSLHKIAALPDETLIYPGHNYTQENYEFALTIEPDNQAVKDLLQKADFTPPSSIAQEKQTNVFLRTPEPQIRKALQMPQATNAEIFAELRQRKNIFG